MQDDRSDAIADRQPGRPILDQSTYLPAVLVVLANTLTRNASAFYRRQFGIGLTDWRIMHRLAAEPEISAHRICRLSHLDKGVVSRSLAWMEKRGLVIIEDDASDARSRRVALSRAGLDLHDRIVAVALARERNLLAVLSEAEVATLMGLLRRLTGNVGAFSKPVPIPPELPRA